MNYRRIDTVGDSVAKTLMARDSKGFGTGFDVQNGSDRLQNEIKQVNFGDGNINCKQYRNGVILNVDDNGNSRTVKAQYHKTSLANFTRTGSTFGATGVVQLVEIEKWE